MATTDSHLHPLAAYAAHSFENDTSYQAGLSTLYSTGALDDLPDEAKEDFLRRSRVFYFNQAYGCNISESDAKQVEGDRAYAHSTQEATSTVIQDQEVSSSTQAPRTLTFAELQSLIEQGKMDEIPNNKHVPDTINEAVPSQPSAPQRKKPWEGPLQSE